MGIINWITVVIVLLSAGHCLAELTYKKEGKGLKLFPSDISHLTTKAELSRNKITTILKSDMSRLTVLRKLTLRNNKIINIEQKCFEGVPIEYLSLARNPLGAFPPLSELGNTLLALYLASCSIPTVTNYQLRNLTKLKILNLEENPITTFEPYLFNGVTNLVDLHLSKSSLTTISNTSFSGLTKLTILHFDSTPLTTFPCLVPYTGLTTRFELKGGRSQVESIPAECIRNKDFKSIKLDKTPLQDVSGLSAAGNVQILQMVSNGPFKPFLPANTLSSWQLSSVLIQNFNAAGFPRLTNSNSTLKVLRISNSNLSCILLEDMDHFGTVELEIIYTAIQEYTSYCCDGNQQSHSTTPAPHLPKLKIMGLQHNQLKVMPNLTHMPELMVILLNGNSMTDIPAGSFRFNPKLTTIILDKNFLTTVPDLSGVAHLKKLSLFDNQIHQIDPTHFGVGITIDELSLKSNGITTLETINLSAIKDTLKFLNIRENPLRSITKEEFGGMTSLKRLYLDHCSLSEFDVATLSGFPALEEISMKDHNRMETLGDPYPYVMRDVTVNIQNTRLQCNASLCWMKRGTGKITIKQSTYLCSKPDNAKNWIWSDVTRKMLQCPEMLIYRKQESAAGNSSTSATFEIITDPISPDGAVTVIKQAGTAEDCWVTCARDNKCWYLEFTAANVGMECWYRVD